MKSASNVLQGMMQAMVGAGNGPRSRGLHPVEIAQLSALLASWYSHGVLPPSSLQDLEQRLEALKHPSAAPTGGDSAGSGKKHVAWIVIPPPSNKCSPREAAQVGLSPAEPSAASASSSPRADDDQKASMGSSLEELLAQNSKNAGEWWGSLFEGRGPFREGPEGHWSLHFRRVQDNAHLRRQKGRGILGINGNDGGTTQDETWRAGVAVSGAQPTTLGFQASEDKVSTGLRDLGDNGVKLDDEDAGLSTPSTVPSEAVPSPERQSPAPAAVAPVTEPAPTPVPAPLPKSNVEGAKKSETPSAPRAEESPSTAKSAKVEGESGQPQEDKSAKSKSGQQSQQKQQQRRSNSREKRELSREEQEEKDRQRREEARRAGKEKGKMRGLEKERQRKDRELQRQRIIAEAKEKKEAAARAEKEAKEKAQAAAIEAEAARRRKESEERVRRVKAAEEEKRRGTRGKSRERERERKRARGEQSRDPDSRGGRHGERAPNGGRQSDRDCFSEKERERGSRGREMDIVMGRDRVEGRSHLDTGGNSREQQRVKGHEDRAGSDDRGRDGRRAHGLHRSSGDLDTDSGRLKHDSRDGDSDNGDRKRRRTKLDHETGDWRGEADNREHRSSKKKSKKERKEKKEKRKDRHSERSRGGSEELRGRKRSRDSEVVDDEGGSRSSRSSRPRSDLRDYADPRADHPPRRPVDPHRQRWMENEIARSGSERRDSSRTGSGLGMGLNLSRQESGGSSKGGDIGDREDRRAGRAKGSEQRRRRNDGRDAPGGRDDVGDTKERQGTREVTQESTGVPSIGGGSLPGMDVYGTGASPPTGLELVGHGNQLGNGRGDHQSKSGSISVDKYGLSSSNGRDTYSEDQKRRDGSRPRLAGMAVYGPDVDEDARGGSREEKGGRDRDHAVVHIGRKGASDRRDDLGRQSGLSTVSGFCTVTACKHIVEVRYSPFVFLDICFKEKQTCLPQKFIWA